MIQFIVTRSDKKTYRRPFPHHYPTHASPDSVRVMNKVFGILLGVFLVLFVGHSENVLAKNWNTGETSGLSSQVLNLKARDLCKLYTGSKDLKYKSLLKKELKKRR